MFLTFGKYIVESLCVTRLKFPAHFKGFLQHTHSGKIVRFLSVASQWKKAYARFITLPWQEVLRKWNLLSECASLFTVLYILKWFYKLLVSTTTCWIWLFICLKHYNITTKYITKWRRNIAAKSFKQRTFF